MKLEIKGETFKVIPVGQWTFEEAEIVERVTTLTPGGVILATMQGSSRADRAFAMVAYMRGGKDPSEISGMALNDIDFDPSPDEAEEAKQSPPDGGGAEQESDAAA